RARSPTESSPASWPAAPSSSSSPTSCSRSARATRRTSSRRRCRSSASPAPASDQPSGTLAGAAMKIALDPYMLRQVPLTELPGVVAELGYQHIELSPRDDFMPFFLHPRADRAGIAAFKAALAGAGVEVAAVLPLYRWSGPDEDERQAAVRN